MKTLLTAMTLTMLSLGQPVGGSVTGSWIAEFEGRTFIRLDLQAVNGAIVGGISLGNFAVDSQGAISRAETAPVTRLPIFNVTLTGSTLRFFVKEGDSADQFQLRLLEKTSAELELLLNDDDARELAASGVRPPKPIRVTKTG